LSSSLPHGHDPVSRIFIHEVRGGRVKTPDPRVVCAGSFLVHALVLRAAGKITARALDAVRRDLIAVGRSAQDIAVLVEEAVSRHGVPRTVADELLPGAGSADPAR
jgi:hypothetical protein